MLFAVLTRGEHLSMRIKPFVKGYKSTLIFVSSYCILNPFTLYFFGQKYSTLPYAENEWLVFLTGPFSFLESIKDPSITFTGIMVQGFFSIGALRNFVVVAFVIFVVELFLPKGVTVRSFGVYPFQTYTLSMLATYGASWTAWHSAVFSYLPGTGTSIIAVCFLTSYAIPCGWEFFSRLIKYIVNFRQNTKNDVNILLKTGLFFSVFTVIFPISAYIGYFSGSLPLIKHSLGLLWYMIWFLILTVTAHVAKFNRLHRGRKINRF